MIFDKISCIYFKLKYRSSTLTLNKRFIHLWFTIQNFACMNIILVDLNIHSTIMTIAPIGAEYINIKINHCLLANIFCKVPLFLRILPAVNSLKHHSFTFTLSLRWTYRSLAPKMPPHLLVPPTIWHTRSSPFRYICSSYRNPTLGSSGDLIRTPIKRSWGRWASVVIQCRSMTSFRWSYCGRATKNTKKHYWT